eukprot:1180110-Prorocentrum_minimum.AAC.4
MEEMEEEMEKEEMEEEQASESGPSEVDSEEELGRGRRGAKGKKGKENRAGRGGRGVPRGGEPPTGQAAHHQEGASMSSDGRDPTVEIPPKYATRRVGSIGSVFVRRRI